MSETSTDEPRQLSEALARYLDPDAFNGRRRSKRNSDAAYRARKLAMKQARAAIRFMVKPGNIDRLMVTAEAKAMEARQGGNGGAGAVHDSAVPDRGFVHPTGSIKGGDRG